SDAEAFVVADRREQEGNCALLLLIWKDVGPRDAGVVIDGDVDELPADALAVAVAAATAGDAMADRIETPKLFDVEMDNLTGRRALVSRARLLRLQRREQAEP